MMLVESFIELLKNLDGQGQLWSPSGQFLGRLSSNPNELNSIINPYGFYGSSFSATSIRNRSGQYGGFQGIYSPFNPNCLNPPFISGDGQRLLVVTRNPNISTNGLRSVTPDFLLAAYEILGNNNPDLVAMQLKALSRTRATLSINTSWDAPAIPLCG